MPGLVNGLILVVALYTCSILLLYSQFKFTASSDVDSRINEDDVTVMIITQHDHDCLKKLVSDIHIYHPNTTISVATTGHSFAIHEDTYVKYFSMPYNSGLSAGRNLLLSQVLTPYIFLVDDNILWDPKMFVNLKNVMEAHPYLDIVGGHVGGYQYAGLMRVVNSTLFLLHGSHRILEGTAHLNGQPCVMVDFVPNFFFARTGSIKSVHWQNNLKVGEHEEFFLRVHNGNYKTSFCPDVTVSQSNCTEANKTSRDESTFIKMGLTKHKISKLANCLGKEYVASDWNQINDIPGEQCYEVPLV